MARSRTALLLMPPLAQAQTALPEIVVTAPSPIVRRAPSPPSRTAPPVPADTAPAPPPAPEAPLPGTLPIVTDQFATVTVVTNEELRRSIGPTLGDLLSFKPGITGSSFAPNASSRPIIRGLYCARPHIHAEERQLRRHPGPAVGPRRQPNLAVRGTRAEARRAILARSA